MRRLSFPPPTTVIALAALFFALGGSAFAIGQATAPQARCQQGAIRGIAVVTGVGSIPDRFVSNPSFFARKFNCTGGGVTVRRHGTGEYDVRFINNGANVALVSAASQTSATVTRNPDGSFRVTIFSPFDNDHQQQKADAPFQMAII
jgi:hypothetical protein